MQVFKFRRLAPIIALIALTLVASCASGTKKYGCPNHLSAPSFLK